MPRRHRVEREDYQVDHVLSSGLLSLLLAAVVAVAVIGPWWMPALSALAIPALFHLVLLERWPSMALVLAYLAGAAWMRIALFDRARTSWRHRQQRTS